MAFVPVYGGLYPRADDDKGGGSKDKDGGGGKKEGGDKPKKEDGGKSNADKAKGTAKATPPPKKEGSWIQNNVELVVAAAVAGLVIIILSLILVWWLLKRKHKKALAASSEEEGSDGESDFGGKGGMDEKSQFGADTANYPHFGAGQPPAQQTTMPATFDGGSETHGAADAYQYHDAPTQHNLAMPGQAKSGGPLRSITEQTEEAEYMQDEPYMQDNDGYDAQSQHGPNQSMNQGQQGGYYPHHVKNSLSDPRDDYYYNEDPAGQRHPQEMDDGSSMYSRQESDVRYK